MKIPVFRILLYSGFVLAANLTREWAIPPDVFQDSYNLSALAAVFLVMNAASFAMTLKLQAIPDRRARARKPMHASFILILLLLAIAIPLQPVWYLIPFTTAGAALTGFCYHHFGDQKTAADPAAGGPPPPTGS